MRDVVIPKNELSEFDLPRVCVITGQTEGVVFKPVKFAWYPRWIVVLVLLNVLIAAIVAMALTKKAKGTLPFSEEGWAQWKRGKLLFGLSLLGTVVILIGGIALLARTESPAPLLTAVLLSILLPIVTYALVLKNRAPVAKKIDDQHITLTLPSDEAASRIKTHLMSGRQSQARVAPQALRSA